MLHAVHAKDGNLVIISASVSIYTTYTACWPLHIGLVRYAYSCEMQTCAIGQTRPSRLSWNASSTGDPNLSVICDVDISAHVESARRGRCRDYALSCCWSNSTGLVRSVITCNRYTRERDELNGTLAAPHCRVSPRQRLDEASDSRRLLQTAQKAGFTHRNDPPPNLAQPHLPNKFIHPHRVRQVVLVCQYK